MTDTHGAARRRGPLSIGHTAVDGIPVVTVCGEIDHAVKDRLNQALLPSSGATPPRIVLDLSGVTFMDSSGIKRPHRRPQEDERPFADHGTAKSSQGL
ncbi:STAS domain-containing protein [Streptomyces sp. Root369]|uniref:STAS domain-containing protein n=1 Tax=Streptomyces sp. Root369 TaxID=1736523 RepID=UPI0007106427|nr:hypothetical protein ASD08_44010 [Streptomyces sp. Root369]